MKHDNHPPGLLLRYRAMMIRRKDFSLALLLATLVITILFTPSLNTHTSFSSDCFALMLFIALTLSLGPLCETLPMTRLLLELSSLGVLALYSITYFYEPVNHLSFMTLTVTLLFFICQIKPLPTGRIISISALSL